MREALASDGRRVRSPQRLACQPALPGATQPTTYCVFPSNTDPRVLDALRHVFVDDAIEVVVEHRGGDRRSGSDGRRKRRRFLRKQPPAADVRRIVHDRGRRIAERRAETEPGPVVLLPKGLPIHACAGVCFLRHVEPDAQLAEDIEAARLVVGFQSGERDEALAGIRKLYLRRVYGFAYAALGDAEAAEGIAARAFVEPEGWLATLPVSSGPLREVLYRIACRWVLASTRLTGGSSLRVLDVERIAMAADVSGLQHQNGSLEWISRPQVRKLVQRLPSHQREVILLRNVLHCTCAETAEILGRPEDAVRASQELAMSFLDDNISWPTEMMSLRRIDQPLEALDLPPQATLTIPRRTA